MKFIVERASDSFVKPKKPCKEAFKMKCTYWELQRVRNLEHFDRKSIKKWKSKGFGHCIKKGNRFRYFHDIHWGVELNSLEDLLKFEGKHGSIILSSTGYMEGYKMIKIYDDYIE